MRVCVCVCVYQNFTLCSLDTDERVLNSTQNCLNCETVPFLATLDVATAVGLKASAMLVAESGEVMSARF